MPCWRSPRKTSSNSGEPNCDDPLRQGDVEHVPGPERHERDVRVVVGRRCRPLLLPAHAAVERALDAGPGRQQFAVVEHPAAVDRSVAEIEGLADAGGLIDDEGVRLRVADDDDPRSAARRRPRSSPGWWHRPAGRCGDGELRLVTADGPVVGRDTCAYANVEREDEHADPDRRQSDPCGRDRRRPRPPGAQGPEVDADPATAYRCLDVPKAGFAERDGDRGGDGEADDGASAGVQDDDDRPAPQVQPVAAPADRGDRRMAEDRPQVRRGRVHDRAHGDAGHDRHERQQPTERRGFGEAGDAERDHQRRDRRRTGDLEAAELPRRATAPAAARDATRMPPRRRARGRRHG